MCAGLGSHIILDDKLVLCFALIKLPGSLYVIFGNLQDSILQPSLSLGSLCIIVYNLSGVYSLCMQSLLRCRVRLSVMRDSGTSL
jgi:hypothetical protein